MNIMIVRPVISQLRALLTVKETIYAICLWGKTQDPVLTQNVVKENQDINWHEWYPSTISIVSYIRKITFFARFIREHDIDVVHLNGLRDVFAIKISSFLSMKFPIIIAMSRNPSIWDRKMMKKIAIIFIMYFVDGFIALSSKHRDILIQNGIKGAKIEFIPNAIPCSIRKKEFIHKQNNESMIFYAAALIPRKNQMILLKAFLLVLRNFPNIKLVLAGSIEIDTEYVNSLMNFILLHNIGHNVSILGQIPHDEVMIFHESCDIVAFPTKSEMMPRAIIEAMTCGKPVVASAVDGILDLIEDNKSGLLIYPDDELGLAKSIIFLLEHPNEAVKLGLEGQRYILDFCSQESVGTKTINFYQKIMSNR